MPLTPTPRTVIGPYYTMALGPHPNVVAPDSPEALRITGRVLDVDGNPIPYTMVETSQPEGWTRSVCDGDGAFEIVTVKPKPNADDRAPHLHVMVLILTQVRPALTFVYFEDEEQANEQDAVLAILTDTQRKTLLATKTEAGYHIDIRISGEGETTFFGV